MYIINTGKGYNTRTESIKIFFDAVLISDNQYDLYRHLRSFHRVAKQYNTQISISKTKTIVINRRPRLLKVELGNHPIEQILSKNCVGVHVSSCHYEVNEVRAQDNTVQRSSGGLGHLEQPNYE